MVVWKEHTNGVFNGESNTKQHVCNLVKNLVMVRAFKSKYIHRIDNSDIPIYNEWVL